MSTRDELNMYRQQLSKLSVEKDQTVFELNKMARMVERLQIQLNEKDGEIMLLKEQLEDQEKYHKIQLEQVKSHYEYLKESALARLKSEMSLDSESMIKELRETKLMYQEILEIEARRKSSTSQDETRCQSVVECQRLQCEKQELKQLIEKLQNGSQQNEQSQELIDEIQYLRKQLQQLTQELEQAKQTIGTLQIQVLQQQDKLREYYTNDL